LSIAKKKEAAPPPPAAHQWQHQHENVYKSQYFLKWVMLVEGI
jgi:hypothetical protein